MLAQDVQPVRLGRVAHGEQQRLELVRVDLPLDLLDVLRQEGVDELPEGRDQLAHAYVKAPWVAMGDGQPLQQHEVLLHSDDGLAFGLIVHFF